MFSGEKVLVTGGSGSIGSEICRKFSQYGTYVYFTYFKNEEYAQTLAKEIGGRAIKVDMEDVADIKCKIDQIMQEAGAIDVLVNNAGMSQILPLSMLDEEDVDKVFNVNMKAPLFVTKHIIRGMIKKRKGVIVNIGSIAGHRLLDVPVTYAMTKAAMSGFTLALAGELKKFNIRVNTIVPGMIDGGVSNGVPEDLRQDFIKHCASGRQGKAVEVAEYVCFIASDRASYINAQNLVIDGGI